MQYELRLADDQGGPLDIGSASIAVTFDAAALQFVSGTPGSLLSQDDTFTATLGDPGEVLVNILPVFPPGVIDQAGVLALLTFQVLANAPTGPTILGFNPGKVELLDSINLEPIPVTATGTATTRIDSPLPPPPPPPEQVPAPAVWALLLPGLLALGRVRRSADAACRPSFSDWFSVHP